MEAVFAECKCIWRLYGREREELESQLKRLAQAASVEQMLLLEAPFQELSEGMRAYLTLALELGGTLPDWMCSKVITVKNSKEEKKKITRIYLLSLLSVGFPT